MSIFNMLRPRVVLRAMFAAAISVWVAGPAAAQSMNQVPLTGAIVEAVIASYPAMKQTADELSAQYGDVGGGGGDPGAAFGAWMAVSAAHGALNSTVQQYGFADYMTWVNTLTSVVFAYTFAEQGGAMDAQMAEAVAQIQNNTNLTDAQKEMMLQQIQASMGAVAAMRPPQANVDAVAPYADQLKVLFEN